MIAIRWIRWLLLPGAALAVTAVVAPGFVHVASVPTTVQFVFTSDAHYGLTRRAFRGGTDVDASAVNGALIVSAVSVPNP